MVPEETTTATSTPAEILELAESRSCPAGYKHTNCGCLASWQPIPIELLCPGIVPQPTQHCPCCPTNSYPVHYSYSWTLY